MLLYEIAVLLLPPLCCRWCYRPSISAALPRNGYSMQSSAACLLRRHAVPWSPLQRPAALLLPSLLPTRTSAYGGGHSASYSFTAMCPTKLQHRLCEAVAYISSQVQRFLLR